ncbi:hypothetical protein [Pseudohalioglobus lutimaris]|uniref:Uncharacterized protein n=1 Tax=Pseudohalioglobus lutimaris TaxID=1737061 RepID=A0A2N5WXD5_9GAMM|nr:hypothetical protein [Pseudohalioglobus lutimaris]PLW66902.1 hypothetical protein C0039_19400 [Pseudohalioglobus lutimaris]
MSGRIDELKEKVRGLALSMAELEIDLIREEGLLRNAINEMALWKKRQSCVFSLMSARDIEDGPPKLNPYFPCVKTEDSDTDSPECSYCGYDYVEVNEKSLTYHWIDGADEAITYCLSKIRNFEDSVGMLREDIESLQREKTFLIREIAAHMLKV